MSLSPTQHFRDFRQRSSGLFGADLFFVNPEGFDFDSVPPYRLEVADVQWPPSRPFFTRLSREYVVDLLDRAVPIFRTFARAYPFLPHTPLQEGLIRALVLFVQRVINRFPEHVSEHWRVIYMDQSHDYWTERPRMPPLFRFSWTVEFSAAHPLVPFQLHEPDHNTLVRIRSPTLVRLLERSTTECLLCFNSHGNFVLGLIPRLRHGIFNSTRSLIQLVPEGRRNRAWVLSLPPYNEIFGRSIFPRDFVFPDGAHENRNRTPFPLWSSAAPLGLTDPLLEFWSQRQTEFPSPESPPVLSPVPRVTPPLRSEGVSPVYVPTSPISSPPFGFSPVSPSTMETSALFRDDTLTDDQDWNVLRSRCFAHSWSFRGCRWRVLLAFADFGGSRADVPMPPVESTPPATQAFPFAASFFRGVPEDREFPRRQQPSGQPCGLRARGAPQQSPKDETPSLFSLALPCRRTATPRRASLRRSTPAPRNLRAPSNGESEAGNDAYVDVRSDDEPVPKRKKTGKKSAAPSSQGDEPRFPPVFRRGRGRSSRTSAYEPEIPLEPFNTPRLAEELLAMMRQPEPTLFDVGCANCMLRNRECSHVTLGTLCPQCHTGKLAACSHQFTVSEHLRGINFLEQYTRLADAQGNRLVTAAMNAREAYNLARAQLLLASTQVAAAQNTLSRWITARLRNLGPTGIPGADEIPEALREDWDDMVDMGRKGLAKEYEFNLNSFPALFEHTSDVDFRGNRDARLNSAISSSRDLLEGLRVKRAAARETTPAGPPDEEFLRAHSSAAGPSHLDFVGTASSSANATAGPSRLDYVPPTSPRSRQAIELLQEQDREQAEKERKEREEAMDLDAPR
ncbi:hypothetical protein B0H12DRAFT_1243018 [Mycena haematopus]|nr:hypothetical protein B0H12DRAFT_1243018 [Mycena haematopus]